MEILKILIPEEVNLLIREEFKSKPLQKLMTYGRASSNKSKNSLDIYIKKIIENPQYMELTSKQEKKWIWPLLDSKEFQIEGRQMLVHHNLKYAISEATSHAYVIFKDFNANSIMELTQAANEGLVEASKRFDISKNCKFITYASQWVHREIFFYISKNLRIVRLPQNKIDEIRKFRKLIDKFILEYNRVPLNDDEIIIFADENKTKFNLTNLLSLNSLYNFPVSIDRNLDRDDNKDNEFNMKTFYNFNVVSQPDNSLDEESKKREIDWVLSRLLKKKEREVIKLYFGIGKENELTLEDIGDLFDLTRERVRQIKDISLKKLRKSQYINYLRQYLG